MKKQRYLDFACGTGRIIHYLEDQFDSSIGVDISSDMLKVASKKVSRARLKWGDLTKDSSLVEGQFDCITAFRFFLNAQPELRDEVLVCLQEKMTDETIFIFNIHGNRHSTRRPVAFLSRIFGHGLILMSLRQTEEMINRAGLEILESAGVVWLDSSYYKYLPRFLWKMIDSAMAKAQLLRGNAVSHMFVCKKKSPESQS